VLNLTISWDLFIVVFFAIVMSYSFIIGKHQSIKIIIASYIGIITTQGIGNVWTRVLGNASSSLASVGIPFDISMIAIAKIFLFALCIILFVIRSGISIEYEKENGTVMTIVLTGLFGFSTAGLVLSTLLTYVAGSGILDATLIAHSVIAPIVKNSPLMQVMIFNQDLWFTLPAFLIIATGFVQNE
jgi:hypothetical protein